MDYDYDQTIGNINWTEWSTIVLHEVQLNNFLGVKTSVALFLSFKTERNFAKEAIKAGLIDVRITWVSNLKKFKSDICNWTTT